MPWFSLTAPQDLILETVKRIAGHRSKHGKVKARDTFRVILFAPELFLYDGTEYPIMYNEKNP